MKEQQFMFEGKELLSRTQVKEYLGVCFNTLDKLGIPRIKIGRGVRYRLSDVQNWLDLQKEGVKK